MIKFRTADATRTIPSRQEETTRTYRLRGAKWIKQIRDEIGDPDASVDMVVSVFLAADNRYRASTIRTIRAWILQVIADEYEVGRISGCDAAELVHQLRTLRPKSKAAHLRRQTSARKRKGATVAELRKVCLYLAAASDEMSQVAAKFLAFGPRVGLRPGEWRSVQLLGDTITWRALKTSNYRGCVAEPKLILVGWTAELLDQLKWLLRTISPYTSDDNKWYKFVERLRSRIAYACKACGIRRISLYTARHIFVATEKLLATDPAKLAAKLNHKTTRTHTRHYARKNCGLPMRVSMTAADPRAVEMVKRVEAFSLERIQQKPMRPSMGGP